MSRIVICGLNGSGKTTLGKELAKRINYLHKDIIFIVILIINMQNLAQEMM